jgi:HEAT repeat protein
MKALADPAPQVRRRAAIEIGRLRIEEAFPALDHATDDPDDLVRSAAVEALGAMGGEDALRCVIRALGDPSEEVRRAATSVLVIDGSENVVHLLCNALGSHPLRYAALEVLSEIGPLAVEPMVDLLAGANGLRPALGQALARMAGHERFAEDLSMLDASLRRRAVEALGAMGGDQSVLSLVGALIDPEPDVRRRAAELLGELGDASAREDLERTVYDPVPEVGTAAREALTRLQEPVLA